MSAAGLTADLPGELAPASLDILLELLDAPGPSGYEGRAAEVWARAAAGFAEVEEDPLGSQYAVVNRGAGHRIVIAGHIDEIGFVITAIDRERALLRFAGIGGWNPAVVVGQRVRICAEGGDILGTVGCLPPHQRKGDQGELALKDLWIDIGAASTEDLMAVVRVGDPVVIDGTPHVYPSGRVMSRSADNRLGCFVALETARRCVGLNVEVIALASVCEETTGHGARVAAYRTAPDEAVVVDVTWTADVPGDHNDDVWLGRGPVITFGAASRSRIGAELLRAADDADIHVQLEGAGSYTGTDTEMFVAAGAGVPTGLVSIPTRYLHSPGELFDLADLEASIQLLVAWLKTKG